MSRETLTDGYVQLMADLYDPQLISRASMTFTLSASSALNVAGGGTPRITLGSGASANCNASHKRWGSCSGFCGGCRRSNYARPIEAGLRVYYAPQSAVGRSATTARCSPDQYVLTCEGASVVLLRLRAML